MVFLHPVPLFFLDRLIECFDEVRGSPVVPWRGLSDRR